jgi:hypothetical protein
MSQILVVINDKLTSDLLKVKLPQKYGVEVIVRNSSTEAKSFLEILPDIDILLCSEKIGQDPVAKKMCEYLISKQEENEADNLKSKPGEEEAQRKIQVVIIGKSAPEYPFVTVVGENPSANKVIMYLGFLLGQEERNIVIEEEAMERERAEKERIEREEQEKLQKELEEKQRIEAERLEKERIAAEIAEKERLEREKEEKKRQLEERLKKAQERQEKLEQERLEKERLEKEKEEKERAEKEKKAKEREERERAFKEKLEQEKAEKERLIREKEEKEKAEKDRIAAEKAEKERLFKEALAKELAEKERLEKEKDEKLKEQKTKEMRERIERGKAKMAQAAKEKAEAERLEKEQLEKEKLEKEKALLEKKQKEELEIRQKLEKTRAMIGQKPKAPIQVATGTQKAAESEDHSDNEKTTVFRMPNLGQAEKKETAVAKPEKGLNNEEYIGFSVNYFSELRDVTFDFDAYSRIKKGDGFEYNKKLKAETFYSTNDLDRVLLRCGKELYVTTSETPKASAFLNSHFLARFKDETLKFNERMKLNSDSFEVLMNVFKQSSFDKNNVEIIKELIKSIDLTSKLALNEKSLRQVIVKNQYSYGYTHFFLTYYFLIQLIDKFPWSKDQSKNKILYMAMFHDLGLQSDRLIKIHHSFTSEKEKLSPEDQQIVINHANASASALEIIVKAPIELTTLIREHHGMKNGIGIPTTVSFSIPPLMMAFIVLEEFVTKYMELSDKNKEGKIPPDGMKIIFGDLIKKYNRSTYLDVLMLLQSFYDSRRESLTG